MIPNGSVTAKDITARNSLTVGSQVVGTNAFFLPKAVAFTIGASSAPSGFHGLWFNSQSTTVLSATRTGATDVGYLPRSYTLNAPDTTLSGGTGVTFTYKIKFSVINRQTSNPYTISCKVTATVSGVSFESDTLTLNKWVPVEVEKTVTSSTNLFSSTGTLSVSFSSNWSGTSGLGPDLNDTGMSLEGTRSGTATTQDVTIKYIP